MHITQQTLSYKTSYDQQQATFREQETLPSLAKPGQQDVKVNIHLQSRQAAGISLSRRDLLQAAAQNRLQQQNKPATGQQATSTASLQAKNVLNGADVTSSAASSAKKTTNDSAADDLSLDAHTRLMKLMIEFLTGKKIQMMPPVGQGSTAVSGSNPPASASATNSNGQQTPAEDHQVRITELSAASEQLRFSASGEVKTSDGRSISINLGFALSYQDVQLSQRLTKQSALKDPLVVNLGSQSADLTDAKFNFDLDNDGAKEALPMLANGSYFLALDKNGNQQIDNGTELFGAQSGNGFADLAQYDEDGNGFIDAADKIYGQLAIWRPDKGMMALADVGVGAIYLHPVDTQFQHLGADGQNESQGVLRSSSVYLKEDGTAGTVQQLDLRV